MDLVGRLKFPELSRKARTGLDVLRSPTIREDLTLLSPADYEQFASLLSRFQQTHYAKLQEKVDPVFEAEMTQDEARAALSLWEDNQQKFHVLMQQLQKECEAQMPS
jgi:hypothetical protein